jgi:predicted ATPase/transcriptional regulator with XRE-family HTH domain
MAMMWLPAFAELLKRHRRAVGLTQEELAEHAGLSARAISNLERGLRHRPRRDTVELLADALQLSPHDRATFIAAARGLADPVVPALRSSLLPLVRAPPAFAEGEMGSDIWTFLVVSGRGPRSPIQAPSDVTDRRLAALAAEGVAEHGGRVLERRGHLVCAAFPSARQALRTAVELQIRLAQETEADPSVPLTAAMGLAAGGAGPAEPLESVLDLAVGIGNLAGPNEVFAAEEVLRRARSMEALAFVDRGRVRLAERADPVQIIQVLLKGDLPEAVPRLLARMSPPSNLPDPPTPFVGRVQVTARLVEMLSRPDVRLLTLTGTGGVGKTRLALQIAAAVLQQHHDGVFFVPLASISDPGLVPAAVAAAVGVKEERATPLRRTLVEYLRPRQLLLVLDNFEQVLDAALFVADLLDSCVRLQVVVTSREILRLSREHVVAVSPLALPARGDASEPTAIGQCDSVALFVQRTQTFDMDFALTENNAVAVAALCRRVDGLPLAIELAAARGRQFSPEELLAQLSRPLRLLTGGPRDAPPRHRTLYAAIDWSFRLLDAGEQSVLARLAVFAGGCTLEAAHEVCNPSRELGLEMAAALASLEEKSLGHQEEGPDGQSRFLLLETIREYAVERLELSREAETIYRRHLSYFVNLAGEADQHLGRSEDDTWMRRLEVDIDNLRAALRWALDCGEIESGLRLVSSAWRFWQAHWHMTEARQWFSTLLAATGTVSAPTRAMALDRAGTLAAEQSDFGAARALHEQSLQLYRELGDGYHIAHMLHRLGRVRNLMGDVPQAQALLEESVARFREMGSEQELPHVLNTLGLLLYYRVDQVRGESLLVECLALCERLGRPWDVANQLLNLGGLALHQGRLIEAESLTKRALSLWGQMGNIAGAVGLCLPQLAWILTSRGYTAKAARLFGVYGFLPESAGGGMGPADLATHEHSIAAARAHLGEEAWSTAWEEGHAMTQQRALAYALDEADEP